MKPVRPVREWVRTVSPWADLLAVPIAAAVVGWIVAGAIVPWLAPPIDPTWLVAARLFSSAALLAIAWRYLS